MLTRIGKCAEVYFGVLCCRLLGSEPVARCSEREPLVSAELHIEDEPALSPLVHRPRHQQERVQDPIFRYPYDCPGRVFQRQRYLCCVTSAKPSVGLLRSSSTGKQPFSIQISQYEVSLIFMFQFCCMRSLGRSASTVGVRFLVEFMDTLKYQVHPWGVLFHLCKLKMWVCEELNPLNPSKERKMLTMRLSVQWEACVFQIGTLPSNVEPGGSPAGLECWATCFRDA